MNLAGPRRRGLGQDWGKSVVLTRIGPARKLTSRQFAGMGINIDGVAAYLGVDYAAGCRRRATKFKSRWTAIRHRIGRVRIAQKARGLVHKVVRRGLVPGILYGAAIRGVDNAMLARVRRIVASARPSGTVGGRSRTIALALSDADPGVEASWAPDQSLDDRLARRHLALP